MHKAPSRKVLIVEDNSDLRRLFLYLLDREGYYSETAEDGVAGLEALQWFKPQMMLLNVMMPRMDGISMLRRLAERPGALRGLRVVMGTACCDNHTFETALGLGAIGYLEYPFAPAELSLALKEAFLPALSDAQMRLRARLRRTVAHSHRGCAYALRAAENLPFGALSLEQRRELHDALLAAAHKSLAEKDAQPSRPGRGVSPELSVLALARTL